MKIVDSRLQIVDREILKTIKTVDSRVEIFKIRYLIIVPTFYMLSTTYCIKEER